MCTEGDKKMYRFGEKNVVGSAPPDSFGMLGRCLPLFYVPVILLPSTQTPSGIKRYFVCNLFVPAFINICMCLCMCVFVKKRKYLLVIVKITLIISLIMCRAAPLMFPDSKSMVVQRVSAADRPVCHPMIML